MEETAQRRVVQVAIPIYTLTDWRPDALPECSACRREIDNGKQYIVIPGSIRMLCMDCAKESEAWKKSVDEAAQYEREREERRRTVEREKRVASSKKRKDRQIRVVRTPAAKTKAPKTPGLPYPPRLAWTTCRICSAPIKPYARKTKSGEMRVRTLCSRACTGKAKRTRHKLRCLCCKREHWPLNRKREGKGQASCSNQCGQHLRYGYEVCPNPPPLRWSRDWDACQDCGTTETEHRGHGYCANCYSRRDRAPGRPGLPKKVVRKKKLQGESQE